MNGVRMRLCKKLLSVFLGIVLAAGLVPVLPVSAYAEGLVVDEGSEPEPIEVLSEGIEPVDDSQVGIQVEQENDAVDREGAEGDETLLDVQAVAQYVLSESPVEGFIWPMKSQAAFCYLTSGTSGDCDLRKFDVQTGKTTTLATKLSAYRRGIYVTDDIYYYYVMTGTYPNYNMEVRAIDLATGTTSTLFSKKHEDHNNALGVDPRGNVYICSSDAFEIYNRSGKLLYKSDPIDNGQLEYFIGFDGTNGNFYFQSSTNWHYWGYDHTMACLKVGNFDGSTVAYNTKSITMFYQTYWQEHYSCAELYEGRYLADLSLFGGNQLAILDSHQINQADVTDTETTISVGDGGLSVTSVALPQKTVLFGARTFDSRFNNYNYDIGSEGSRCTYLPSRDLVAVITESNAITCYGLEKGNVVGTVGTASPAYKPMTVNGELVVLERDASDNFAVECFDVSPAKKIAIDGPSTVKIGGSADYAVSSNSDVLPSVEFASSDPTILSIDSRGRAAAWKAGSVTVTATASNGLKATKTVKVNGGGVNKTRADVVSLQKAVGVDTWNANDYKTTASVVRSYLVETSSGLMRVQARESDVLVEYYDNTGAFISSKSIKNELPLFGGFFAGKSAYYLVFGQANTAESDASVVMRVVRYDTSWGKVKSCDVKGANTRVPFDAGSLRMAESGGKLYIHTCHTMYKSDDGYNHQANMTYAFKESNMTLVDSYYDVMNLSEGYVSHSFNQFICADSSYVYRVDHGDSYPRGITFTATPVTNTLSNPTITGVLHSYANDYGYGNYTGVSIGGFQMSDTGALVAYNEDAGGSTVRNAMLSSWQSDGDGSTSAVAVSSYVNGSNTTCLTPHLVKLNGRHFLLMWAEYTQSTGGYCAKFARVDHAGNIVGDVVSKALPLSDCAPVVLKDGSVAWIVSSGSVTKLYTINPYDLESMDNDNFADRLLGSPFVDVTNETAHVNDIYWLSMNKISEGWPVAGGKREFRPYANVARADMAAFLFRLAREWGIASDAWQPTGAMAFEDVDASTAHYREIMWLAENGVSAGWDLGGGKREFRPYANVARADMAAFLARLNRLRGVETTGSKDFIDVFDSTPHASDIRWLAAAGISTGWKVASGSEYRPYDNVARADMAAFLHRLSQ